MIVFSSPPNRRGFFESSSEYWGGTNQTGKYPVKLYTIDGVLIYQADNGGDNTAKFPKGGIIVLNSLASSMLDAIANPITIYGAWGSVINQSGHSGDLYNYYWTSYSRGTDGANGNMNWHNAYLDGYIPLRVKSIYDPCPYLYRIPSNGTYNQFNFNLGWTAWSYLGGASWKMNILEESWLLGTGERSAESTAYDFTGIRAFYYLSTTSSQSSGYILQVDSGKVIVLNRHDWGRLRGISVRCIEELSC